MGRLWIHTGEEQRVVADMFPALPLLYERGRGTVNGIGSKQHLSYFAHRITRRIADTVDVLGPAKFRKQVGDVTGYLRVPQTQARVVALGDNFVEQLA
jgi:hypothetical protein